MSHPTPRQMSLSLANSSQPSRVACWRNMWIACLLTQQVWYPSVVTQYLEATAPNHSQQTSSRWRMATRVNHSSMTITNTTAWFLKAYPSNKSRHNMLESRSLQSWRRNIPIRLKCISHLVISSSQSYQWLKTSQAVNLTKSSRDSDLSQQKSSTIKVQLPPQSDNTNVNTIDTLPNLKQPLYRKRQLLQQIISTQCPQWNTRSRLTSQDQSHSLWRSLSEIAIPLPTSARKGKRKSSSPGTISSDIRTLQQRDMKQPEMICTRKT